MSSTSDDIVKNLRNELKDMQKKFEKEKKKRENFGYIFRVYDLDAKNISEKLISEVCSEFSFEGCKIRTEEVLYQPNMAPILVSVVFVIWDDSKFPISDVFGNSNWGQASDYSYIPNLPSKIITWEKERANKLKKYVPLIINVSKDVYSTLKVSYRNCANNCIFNCKVTKKWKWFLIFRR